MTERGAAHAFSSRTVHLGIKAWDLICLPFWFRLPSGHLGMDGSA